jgi:hypothetical protein
MKEIFRQAALVATLFSLCISSAALVGCNSADETSSGKAPGKAAFEADVSSTTPYPAVLGSPESESGSIDGEANAVAVMDVEKPVDCTIEKQIEPRLGDKCSFIEEVRQDNGDNVKMQVDVYVSEPFGNAQEPLHALVLSAAELGDDGQPVNECVACGGNLTVVVARKQAKGYKRLATSSDFTGSGTQGEPPGVDKVVLSAERLAILVTHKTFNGFPGVEYQQLFEITKSGVKSMLAKDFVTSCANECTDMNQTDCSKWTGELTITAAAGADDQPSLSFKQSGQRRSVGAVNVSDKMKRNGLGQWTSNQAMKCGDIGS